MQPEAPRTPDLLRLPASPGIQLAALQWSESGVPMVFLHGYGNDAHVWDEIVPCVMPHYRTLAISLRGHGDSDWGEHPGYSHAELAADLSHALEALEIERLVLVGHSLGGRVAMHFAGAHPERMAGLVIADSGPEMDARGSFKIRDEVRSQMRRSDPSFASPDEYLRTLVRQYPAAKPSTLEALSRHWTRQREDGRFVLKQDLRRPEAPSERPDAATLRERARGASRELWDALAKVACPTLVIRGAASDVLSADVADRMVEDVLARGQLAVIPAAGHSVMLDNPDAFVGALSDFALG